jgi:hypothetical protein
MSYTFKITVKNEIEVDIGEYIYPGTSITIREQYSCLNPDTDTVVAGFEKLIGKKIDNGHLVCGVTKWDYEALD